MVENSATEKRDNLLRRLSRVERVENSVTEKCEILPI